MHDNNGSGYFSDLQKNVHVYIEALNEYIQLGGRHGDWYIVKMCIAYKGV